MILHQIKMYQSNLINDCLDTFFLYDYNVKDLIYPLIFSYYSIIAISKR